MDIEVCLSLIQHVRNRDSFHFSVSLSVTILEDEVAQISENISNNTEGIPVTDLP